MVRQQPAPTTPIRGLILVSPSSTHLGGVLRVDRVGPGAHDVEAVGLSLPQQVAHQLSRTTGRRRHTRSGCWCRWVLVRLWERGGGQAKKGGGAAKPGGRGCL